MNETRIPTCIEFTLAASVGRELHPLIDNQLIKDLEAATAPESNLITNVYECQVPGCDRQAIANYIGNKLVVESSATRGECLKNDTTKLAAAARWQIKFALSEEPRSPSEAAKASY